MAALVIRTARRVISMVWLLGGIRLDEKQSLRQETDDGAVGAARVLLQLGNPDCVPRQMLAGEDAHAARAFGERPAEYVELGFARAAVRQIDRAAEMHRSQRLEPARLELGGTGGGIVGGERG